MGFKDYIRHMLMLSNGGKDLRLQFIDYDPASGIETLYSQTPAAITDVPPNKWTRKVTNSESMLYDSLNIPESNYAHEPTWDRDSSSPRYGIYALFSQYESESKYRFIWCDTRGASPSEIIAFNTDRRSIFKLPKRFSSTILHSPEKLAYIALCCADGWEQVAVPTTRLNTSNQRLFDRPVQRAKNQVQKALTNSPISVCSLVKLSFRGVLIDVLVNQVGSDYYVGSVETLSVEREFDIKIGQEITFTKEYIWNIKTVKPTKI